MFYNISENDELYQQFYQSFSTNIKLGIHEDSANRDKLAGLLRYFSTESGDTVTSLQDYIGRMKENQPGIYFITGESRGAVENSPFIEKLRSRGFEVLYMVDAIDEYVIQQLKEFDGKKLLAADKEGLDLGETEEEKTSFEEAKKNTENLCSVINEILGDEVQNVVVSNRIVDSPCVLVTANFGWSANMARIMKAQAMANPSQGAYMAPKKILELNPGHPIVVELSRRVVDNQADKTVKDLVWLLYDTSLLSSGFSLDAPTKFSNRIHRLIKLGLSLDDEEEHDDDANQDLEASIINDPSAGGDHSDSASNDDDDDDDDDEMEMVD